jgi:3-deoxy-D-manno-octulosonic acid (KDO) 8-phosphate synthase
VAVVRTPEKAGELAALGVKLHPGDVTDKESMRAPMTGVDGVFLEVHEDPARAMSDAANALPLDRLGPLLERLSAINAVVKSS